MFLFLLLSFEHQIDVKSIYNIYKNILNARHHIFEMFYFRLLVRHRFNLFNAIAIIGTDYSIFSAVDEADIKAGWMAAN